MPEIVADDTAIGLSDTAHFHLSGYVNRQNFNYWSEENVWQLYECPLHSEYVRIWCCVGSYGVMSPYCCEQDRYAATENSGHYVHILHYFLTRNE
jgi:hypothetical protein